MHLIRWVFVAVGRYPRCLVPPFPLPAIAVLFRLVTRRICKAGREAAPPRAIPGARSFSRQGRQGIVLRFLPRPGGHGAVPGARSLSRQGRQGVVPRSGGHGAFSGFLLLENGRGVDPLRGFRTLSEQSGQGPVPILVPVPVFVSVSVFVSVPVLASVPVVVSAPDAASGLVPGAGEPADDGAFVPYRIGRRAFEHHRIDPYNHVGRRIPSPRPEAREECRCQQHRRQQRDRCAPFHPSRGR